MRIVENLPRHPQQLPIVLDRASALHPALYGQGLPERQHSFDYKRIRSRTIYLIACFQHPEWNKSWVSTCAVVLPAAIGGIVNVALRYRPATGRVKFLRMSTVQLILRQTTATRQERRGRHWPMAEAQEAPASFTSALSPCQPAEISGYNHGGTYFPFHNLVTPMRTCFKINMRSASSAGVCHHRARGLRRWRLPCAGDRIQQRVVFHNSSPCASTVPRLGHNLGRESFPRIGLLVPQLDRLAFPADARDVNRLKYSVARSVKPAAANLLPSRDYFCRH